MSLSRLTFNSSAGIVTATKRLNGGIEMKLKKFVATALAAVMALSLSACGEKSTESDATKAADSGSGSKATLVMATNAAFEPYEYYDDNGTIVGIDAEVAALIAEELGMELQIEDMEFDSIITAVSSGKADMGMAGMTITEDRKKNINFTDTYATARQVIIVTEDSDIKGAEDLADKTIGVQLGTTGDIYVSDEVEGATVERYNKGFEAVQALSQNKVDAVVIDNEPAKKFVEQQEGTKILDEAYTEEEYAIAIAKDNTELLDKVNAALEKLKEEGKIDEIVNKYITAE
jgi:polar amino acid transport system substrate-binding protein